MAKSFMTRSAIGSTVKPKDVTPSKDIAELEAIAGEDTSEDNGETEEEGNGEGETVINYDGTALAARASDLAHLASEDLLSSLSAMADTKEQVSSGVFPIMFALMETYGDDLAEWPEPGSDTGNNPDAFKIPVVKGGKTTNKRTTFYAQFAANTPEGADMAMKIEWCERMDNDKAVKDDIDRLHLDMTPIQRDAAMNRYKGRLNTIRTAIIGAVKLYRQLNAVNEMVGLKAEPLWSDDTQRDVMNTTKPIQIWQPSAVADKPPVNWTSMSVGAFLRLDPAKAQEKGGTFRNLVDSAVVARPNGTTAGGDTKALTIKTLDTSVSVLVEQHRYFDEIFSDKDRKVIGQLYKALNAKDNDELVVTVVEMRNMLNDIVNDCKLDAKYQRIQTANPDLTEQRKTA